MQTSNSFWTTYVDLGANAQRLGQTAIADSMLGAALDESRRLGHLNMPPPAVFNKLAASFYSRNDFKKAEAVYKSAIATYERRLGGSHPHLSNILTNLAELYFSQGKFAQAEPLYERALEIEIDRESGWQEQTHRRMLKLSWIYCELGKHSQAYALLRKVQKIKGCPIAEDQELPMMVTTC